MPRTSVLLDQVVNIVDNHRAKSGDLRKHLWYPQILWSETLDSMPEKSPCSWRATKEHSGAFRTDTRWIPIFDKLCISIELLLNDRKPVVNSRQGSVLQVQVQPRSGVQVVKNCVINLLIPLDSRASGQAKQSEHVLSFKSFKKIDEVLWS